MTHDELEALLALLHTDREEAGKRYEAIRQRLSRLFEWRGCANPEDLVDVVFDRVAHKIFTGVELQSRDPFAYCCGVAHLVYKETLRRTSRENRALETGDWLLPAPPEDDSTDNPRAECLRLCLEELTADQRHLILRYHQGEHNIRHRKALSEEMGLPLNALRIRVHRVRKRLETCIHECLRR